MVQLMAVPIATLMCYHARAPTLELTLSHVVPQVIFLWMSFMEGLRPRFSILPESGFSELYEWCFADLTVLDRN